jgi:hypothetical protein
MERHIEKAFTILKAGAEVPVVHSWFKNRTVQNDGLEATPELFTHHENEIW